MKVRNTVICALVFGLCLVFVSSASAFSLFNRDVSKARKFIKAGMYPQAIAVLEKRINEEPDDAEAHFLLGRCYIHTGNLGGADERFESAVRLDADYGYKIGGEYRRAGSDALARGNVDRALRLFGKAVKYQPGLKKQIAGECYREGMVRLNFSLLQLAAAYDPGLKETIARECFEKGKSILEAKAGKKGATLKRREARNIYRYMDITYSIEPS
jgi:tetratricopeptide (TPR) repeat protein